jgi:ribosomal protein L19
MPIASPESQLAFDELRAGDRIEVEHRVTVGMKNWTTRTQGTVVRTERRRHGLHFRRNVDDKVFSDVILLELPDGELTTIAVDEFTVLRRA